MNTFLIKTPLLSSFALSMADKSAWVSEFKVTIMISVISAALIAPPGVLVDTPIARISPSFFNLCKVGRQSVSSKISSSKPFE